MLILLVYLPHLGIADSNWDQNTPTIIKKMNSWRPLPDLRHTTAAHAHWSVFQFVPSALVSIPLPQSKFFSGEVYREGPSDLGEVSILIKLTLNLKC